MSTTKGKKDKCKWSENLIDPRTHTTTYRCCRVELYTNRFSYPNQMSPIYRATFARDIRMRPTMCWPPLNLDTCVDKFYKWRTNGNVFVSCMNMISLRPFIHPMGSGHIRSNIERMKKKAKENPIFIQFSYKWNDESHKFNYFSIDWFAAKTEESNLLRAAYSDRPTKPVVHIMFAQYNEHFSNTNAIDVSTPVVIMQTKLVGCPRLKHHFLFRKFWFVFLLFSHRTPPPLSLPLLCEIYIRTLHIHLKYNYAADNDCVRNNFPSKSQRKNVFFYIPNSSVFFSLQVVSSG